VVRWLPDLGTLAGLVSVRSCVLPPSLPPLISSRQCPLTPFPPHLADRATVDEPEGAAAEGHDRPRQVDRRRVARTDDLPDGRQRRGVQRDVDQRSQAPVGSQQTRHAQPRGQPARPCTQGETAPVELGRSRQGGAQHVAEGWGVGQGG
jgi:hypothetical protein